MIVSVKLFAAAKDLAGSSEIEIEIDDGADVAALRIAIGDTIPELKDLLRRSHVAIDQKYADNRATLLPNREIALIPPVSGG